MKKILICIMAISVLICGCDSTGISQSSYNELQSKNSEITDNYKTLQDSYSELYKKSNTPEYKKAMENASKLTELQSQVDDAQSKLNSLNGQVAQASGNPLSFSAGVFYCGTDFPPGRYKIYGGTSNFSAYDSSGSIIINIILGTNKYSVSEYVYTFAKAQTIKSESAFKIQLIK